MMLLMRTLDDDSGRWLVSAMSSLVIVQGLSDSIARDCDDVIRIFPRHFFVLQLRGRLRSPIFGDFAEVLENTATTTMPMFMAMTMMSLLLLALSLMALVRMVVAMASARTTMAVAIAMASVVVAMGNGCDGDDCDGDGDACPASEARLAVLSSGASSLAAGKLLLSGRCSRCLSLVRPSPCSSSPTSSTSRY